MSGTEEELKRCGDAFRALNIPAWWRFERYDRTLTDPDDEGSGVQSYGAWLVDIATIKRDITRYRIVYHIDNERLSLLEQKKGSGGKPQYKCVITNKTVDEINELLCEYEQE